MVLNYIKSTLFNATTAGRVLGRHFVFENK